jgi:hypothetical protein
MSDLLLGLATPPAEVPSARGHSFGVQKGALVSDHISPRSQLDKALASVLRPLRERQRLSAELLARNAP